MNCAQKKQLGHPKFLQSSLKKLQQRHLLMKNLNQHRAKSKGWEKIVNLDMDFSITAWYQIRIPDFLPDQNLPHLMRDYQKKTNAYREIDLKLRRPKTEGRKRFGKIFQTSVDPYLRRYFLNCYTFDLAARCCFYSPCWDKKSVIVYELITLPCIRYGFVIDYWYNTYYLFLDLNTLRA